MNAPLISVILRSYNEGWALGETLDSLARQDYPNWELIVIDSGSTDGSLEMIRAANPAHLNVIKPADYNPSRVINYGMRTARAEFCLFLNADATPQGVDWMRRLAEPLRDPRTAAVFGRQIPRLDCRAVYASDYHRCFGPERESARWEHFFSMVSSGLRKDIWSRRGFLEKLQFAEDDEYTRWAKKEGFRVQYVPEAVVMHSHNYTPEQAYRRSFGDARALAASWPGRPSQFNWLRTVLFGALSDLRHDIKFCVREKRGAELPHALRVRWAQRRGRLAGFKAGWREYRLDSHENPRFDESVSAPLRGRI